MTLTLMLPTGFSYDAPGNSPAAHVFVFQSGPGFDLHYPPNEVTSSVSQSRDGNTIIIYLSNLDIGFGAGIIPATYTIYARAKAHYSDTSVPQSGTLFVFNTSATANSDNAGSLSASSDSSPYVIANPSAGCTDGKLNQ